MLCYATQRYHDLPLADSCWGEEDGGREEDKVEEMEEEGGGGSLAPVLNKRLQKKQ